MWWRSTPTRHLIEVYFLDYPDTEMNELGARGIGEIGLAGVAAAITAAVHHATGVRVRELPVKIGAFVGVRHAPRFTRAHRTACARLIRTR